MIKLKCQNPDCNYCYSVSEKEFEEYGTVYHSKCMICGSQLKLDNVEEFIRQDIYKRVGEYIDIWFKKIGIEATLELVERNKDNPTYRIYKELLEKRGFKIK